MDLLHLHLKKLIETITQDHAQQQVKYLQHLQHLQQQQQLQLQQIQNINSLHVPLTPSSTTNALANHNNSSSGAVNLSGANTSNINFISNGNNAPAVSAANESFASHVITNSNAGTPITPPIAVSANSNLLKTQTNSNSVTNINSELNTRDNFIINQHQQQLLTITNAINSYVQQQQQQNLLIIKLEELINTLIQVSSFIFRLILFK